MKQILDKEKLSDLSKVKQCLRAVPLPKRVPTSCSCDWCDVNTEGTTVSKF